MKISTDFQLIAITYMKQLAIRNWITKSKSIRIKLVRIIRLMTFVSIVNFTVPNKKPEWSTYSANVLNVLNILRINLKHCKKEKHNLWKKASNYVSLISNINLLWDIYPRSNYFTYKAKFYEPGYKRIIKRLGSDKKNSSH